MVLRIYEELNRDRGVVLDLLTSEFQVRQQRQERVTLQEFVGRFPNLSQDLAQRLQAVAQPEGETFLLPTPIDLPPPVPPAPPVRALVQVLSDGQVLNPVQLGKVTRTDGRPRACYFSPRILCVACHRARTESSPPSRNPREPARMRAASSGRCSARRKCRYHRAPARLPSRS